MHRDDTEAPTHTQEETNLKDHEPCEAFHSRCHVDHRSMAESFKHSNPTQNENEAYDTKKPENKHLATRSLHSTHVAKHANQARDSKRQEVYDQTISSTIIHPRDLQKGCHSRRGEEGRGRKRGKERGSREEGHRRGDAQGRGTPSSTLP